MDVAIVVGLFVNYAATMAVFGAAAFRLLIVDAEVAVAVDPRLKRWLIFASFAALLGAIALTMLEAGSMAGDWSAALDTETIGAVLTRTAFGHVWLWRLGIAVIVALCAIATRPSAPWIAFSAAFLLASLALVGHAAMSEGAVGAIRRATQAIHLLAGGAWIGGAISLALALVATRHRPRAAIPILLRFSLYGAGAVVLIVASGTLNAVALLGTVGALIGVAYGWALLVKILLVAMLIVLASYNRFVLVRRLAIEPDTAMRRLRRSVGLEIALGALVVLVASRLGTLPPPGG